ncbi:hypothetical protein J6590_033060 [Homalodisca vitripennis]|nr:hypothetical protein J6590_033060 [Homalodisca vitripennis]
MWKQKLKSNWTELSTDNTIGLGGRKGWCVRLGKVAERRQQRRKKSDAAQAVDGIPTVEYQVPFKSAGYHHYTPGQEVIDLSSPPQSPQRLMGNGKQAVAGQLPDPNGMWKKLIPIMEAPPSSGSHCPYKARLVTIFGICRKNNPCVHDQCQTAVGVKTVGNNHLGFWLVSSAVRGLASDPNPTPLNYQNNKLEVRSGVVGVSLRCVIGFWCSWH